MKNHLFFLMVLITSFFINACGKYDEGPDVSLRTKKERLLGEWEYQKKNNIDITSNKSKILFEDDGYVRMTVKYSFWDTSFIHQGEWSFSKDKKYIEVQIEDNLTKYFILRLTKNDLWYDVRNDDVDKIKYELKKI